MRLALECNRHVWSSQTLAGLQVDYVARFVARTHFTEQQHIDVFEQLTVSAGFGSGQPFVLCTKGRAAREVGTGGDQRRVAGVTQVDNDGVS